MRAWATAPSQRRVPTLSMPIWPETMTIFLGIDHRLEDRHGAIIEIEGVGVVRRTAEQFDVAGAGAAMP